MRGPLPDIVLVLMAAALAGCTDPTGTGALGDPPGQGATLMETPVAYSGTLGPTVFACGPMGCVGESTRPQPRVDLEANGTVRAISLTLTWQATSPATQQLRLGVSWNETGSHDFHSFDGASPLKVDLHDLAIRHDELPYAWVFIPETGGAPAYLATEQEITIAGNLISEG